MQQTPQDNSASPEGIEARTSPKSLTGVERDGPTRG
jgi:hypothetical protein